VFGDLLPGVLEPGSGSMFQSRGELHDGAEVVQLIALPAHLYQEPDDVGPVHRVALVGDTPHEEQGQLQDKVWFFFVVVVVVVNM